MKPTTSLDIRLPVMWENQTHFWENIIGLYLLGHPQAENNRNNNDDAATLSLLVSDFVYMKIDSTTKIKLIKKIRCI